MKKGDEVKFKKTGTPATVIDVSFNKVLVEFVGNLSGKVMQNWVDKSAVKKA